MRRIIVEIPATESHCNKCQCIDYLYCTAFDAELKAKEGDYFFDEHPEGHERCPECKAAEVTETMIGGEK